MKTFFTCLFVSVALFGFGQQSTFKVAVNPITFNENDDSYSYLNQLTQLSDGSLVGVGIIYDEADKNILNAYLLKTDLTGKVLASKSIFAGSDYSEAYSITKSADGGFAVCIGTAEGTTVVKFKADLTQQWLREYGTASVDSFADYRCIIQTPDGGYLLAGTVGIFSDFTTAYSVLKTDSNGGVLFAKSYSTFGNKSVSGLTATTDGNYAFAAITTRSDETKDTTELLKISPAGSLLWMRQLYDATGALNFYADAVMSSSDGGIVISGDAYDYSGTPDIDKALMAKYDNTGKLLWSKVINVPGNTESEFPGLVEDKDGGYLFGGYLFTYTDDEHNNADSSFGYAAKTNAAGALQWTKTYASGVGVSGSIFNLIPTADGGFAGCGEGYVYRPDVDDYGDASVLFKFNSNLISCGDSIGSQGTLQSLGVNAVFNTSPDSVGIAALAGSVSLFDNGYINAICQTTAFPVHFTSFTAALQGKRVIVNWATANEVNTDYFVVERSADGLLFTALQKIAAKGNSSVTQAYSTNDLQPLPGTSYYRLKEVDKDGKTTYSFVVKVTVMSNGTIVISPNPVQSNVRVIIQSSVNSNVTIQVIDVKGNVMATQKRTVNEGRNEINIPAASLAKGVYILKVMDKGSVQTIRFVKE